MHRYPHHRWAFQTASRFRSALFIAGVFFCAVIALLGFFQVIKAGARGAAQEGPTIADEDNMALATDLQLRAVVDRETARPSEFVTYTLRYTNTLALPVANVVISSTLNNQHVYSGTYQSLPAIPPEQFSYTSGASQPYVLNWRLPVLAPFATGVITVSAQAAAWLQPDIDNPMILIGNAAAIGSTQSPPVSGNSNDAVVMIVGPLLSTTKASSPGSVFPGHYLTYTLTILNNLRSDAAPATNLVVVDQIPASTRFISAGEGGVYAPATNQVIWNIPGPLLPGASLTRSFVVLVNDRLSSGGNLNNHNNAYSARADGMALPEPGRTNLYTPILAVLQKTALDKDRTANPTIVFPTEEVTYTVTVHNPLSVTLTGVVVTDTLPGTPQPFTYLRPAAGSPAPIVASGGRNLRWVVDLPAWGSVTRAFVVQIPWNTAIGDNRNDFTFTNQLTASHPVGYFHPVTNLAAVRVDAPLRMSKTVTPSHAMTDEVVTYTLSLENRGPYIVSGIRLTDTLEGNFHYLSMANGPEPLPQYRQNPVVWSDLSVSPGQTLQLRMRVVVDGQWLQRYYNNLHALSPVVYIPARTHVAEVLVDPPIYIEKTVAPQRAFVGSTVRYDITLSNRDDLPWTLNWIEDDLPDWFYQIGGANSNIAQINIQPPFTIPPGGTWSGGFDARVQEVDCNDLPKAYPNSAGAVTVHFTSPEDILAENAQNLAPLTVDPHIQVDLIPMRQAVQPGDIFTYTLHLKNISTVDVVNSQFMITLPNGFSYVDTVSGPAPAQNGRELSWTGISVGALNQRSILFRVQVSPTLGYGWRVPSWSSVSPGYCLGRLGTGDNPQGDGRVNVVQWVVRMTKRELNQRIPPLTLTDFEIVVANVDAYPFLLESIVDIMPPGFTYHSMVSGPAPSRVEGNRVIWENVNLPASPDLRWTIRLQSGPVYGEFRNVADAESDATNVLSATSNIISVLPLFDLKKDVYPTTTVPGLIVPYTITLVNLSTQVYTSLLVTDTLPAGFTYVRTRSGPVPFSVGPNNGRPVWQIPTLNRNCPGGCVIKLAFDVRIFPLTPPGVYYNEVIGSSPSGSVPGPILTAPITVTEINGTVYLPIMRR